MASNQVNEKAPVVFPDDVMKNIIADYESGDLISELEKRYGHVGGTIRKALKAHGVAIRNNHETYRMRAEKRAKAKAEAELKKKPEDLQIRDLGKVRALYNAGWSIHEIALEFISEDSEVQKCLEVLKMN